MLTYNEKNQWVKRISFDEDGNQKDVMTYEYNDKGHLLKATTCCKYNYHYTYQYKYDKYGNWIEKVEIYSQTNKNGDQIDRESMRFYRIITYYSDYADQ